MRWAAVLVLVACGRVHFTAAPHEPDAPQPDAAAQPCASDTDCGLCQRCDATSHCQAIAIDLLYLGHRSTCFLDSDGARWCAGDLVGWTLGAPASRHAGDSAWTALYPGWSYYLGLHGNELDAWSSTSTYEVSADTSWAQVSVETGPYCMRHAAGDAECNSTAIAGTWADLDGGDVGTCGVQIDGTLWCWGTENGNQLGLGVQPDGTVFASPTQVGTATDWLVVHSGNGVTCAMKTDHTIWCTGSSGFTGTNGADTAGVMTRISPDTDWKWLDVRWQHGCAGKTDGRVLCWGWDDYAMIMPGASMSAPVPAELTPGTTWDQFLLGGHHYCGVPHGETRWWCWGYNNGGQLLDGTTTTRLAPAPICM
ncbi:MAG TPA: hypothetical protein VGF94_28860 [Kofleriaceae bacterium]|jgi:hypothetical protein